MTVTTSDLALVQHPKTKLHCIMSQEALILILLIVVEIHFQGSVKILLFLCGIFFTLYCKCWLLIQLAETKVADNNCTLFSCSTHLEN